MEKKKVRFCITVVQTLSEDKRSEAFDFFVENLRELGASDDKITELANKNRTYWHHSTDVSNATVYVEIVRYGFESN